MKLLLWMTMLSSIVWNVDAVAATDTKVVLITIDGVRHQEFFHGTDPMLAKNLPIQNREALMPFVWRQLVDNQRAWVFGNRSQGSLCRTDNSMTVSLPAYADLLSGVRQSKVTKNTFNGRMGFPTVPDRLLTNGFRPQDIAVLSSWENIERVVTQSGEKPSFFVQSGRQSGEMNPPWWFARYDSDTMRAVEKKLQAPSFEPRFLMISFNDSDEWGHKEKYPNYLAAIHNQDQYIRRIYSLVESKPGYAGNTIYVITTDHGRGELSEWKNHGNVPGSELIWAVVYSPTLELKPTTLLSYCSHTAITQWIYEVLTSQEFQKGSVGSQ